MDQVTINLNIPHLMALNNFYQESFQPDTRAPVEQPKHRTNDELDHSPSNAVLQVKGIVKQPKIVLFADPEKQCSRTLVLDVGIFFIVDVIFTL